jgi:hypothetical protein
VISTSSIYEETECSLMIVTETQTSVVTLTVISSTPSPGYDTVTGEPSTITDVNTDTSFTSGLPDVTVSGNPSTLTDIETDVSYTPGLPDVTISGDPATVTDYRTDVSVTSSLPDVTVSGEPLTKTEVGVSYSLTGSTRTSVVTITVTNLFGTESRTTVTELATTTKATSTTTVTSKTPVVVTVTDLYPTLSTSTEEYYFSSAKGEGVTRSTSSEPLYPTNGTVVVVGPSGTITTVLGPTLPPPIISGADKGLTSPVGCTLALIVALMYML